MGQMGLSYNFGRQQHPKKQHIKCQLCFIIIASMCCPYFTLLQRKIPGDPSAENTRFTGQAGTDEDKKDKRLGLVKDR